MLSSETKRLEILRKSTLWIYTPYLPQIIKIANYLEISLDYLAHLSDKNNFKLYKNKPTNFYSKLCSIMQQKNISQSKLAKDILCKQVTWTWAFMLLFVENGKLPKMETLIKLSKFLNCSIDFLIGRSDIEHG